MREDEADLSGAPPEGNPGAAPEAAESEVEAARREAQAYLDDLKRLKAEFENYRKRALKEQTQVVERASQRLIEKVLPALDEFELALLSETADAAKLARGVEMVYGKVVEILQSEGLRRIDEHGVPFDPERHEAVMTAEGDGDELVVAEVLRPGYALKGRVIRPAMVKVAPRAKDGEATHG